MQINTWDSTEYHTGDKVIVSADYFCHNGKDTEATIFGEFDYATGSYYESGHCRDKQVRERTVQFANGRTARIPYHSLRKAVAV